MQCLFLRLRLNQNLDGPRHVVLCVCACAVRRWADDQPGFVCGNDPNGNSNKCVGWDGVPGVDNCDGSYPEQCRVCHCVDHNSVAATGPPGTGDHGPWGQSLFGHTANNGGVYSTIRIPFGRTLRVCM